MYQELSKRERVSIVKMSLAVIALSVTLIVFNIVVTMMHLEGSIMDIMTLGSVVVFTYILLRKYLISYKYMIIEEELIIQELMGSKEKIVLNINMHQIKEFIKPSHIDDLKSYNYKSRRAFFNGDNTDNRRYLMYEEDNENHLIIIQPSDVLIELIESFKAKGMKNVQ